MHIEYEATFVNVDKDEVRARLRTAGAVLVRPEFTQRRVPFDLPGAAASGHVWARVRDEGDKVTMSVKMSDGDGIENQKELCIEVSNFDEAVALLTALGCKPKSYQETRRELWTLSGAEITIDEWPFLEPFVEVEGTSEDIVRSVSEKIGFDFSKALFCAVGRLYVMKYGVSLDDINNAKKLVFDMDNPFLSP